MHALSFKIGNSNLESIDIYNYLGVTFYDKTDYTLNSEFLGKAAGCALGSIINKIHGLKDCGKIDNEQNRAMRYFLGIHRFTPIQAMVGDTGWLSSVYRRWLAMLRV